MAFEIEFMKWVHSWAAAFEPVTKFVTEIGAELAILAIIAFVYFMLDKKKGENLAFTVLASAGINGICKTIIRRPRPFTKDPSLSSPDLIEQYTDTYSFPSGHSQNAGSMYQALMLTYKKTWVKALCIIAMILVPLSRVFLGVHYPSDVIVGTALGIGLAFLFMYLLQRFDQYRLRIFLISAGIFFLITMCVYFPISFFTAVDTDTIKSLGAFCGFAIGACFENRFVKSEIPPCFWKKLLRFALALCLMLGLKIGLKALFSLAGDHMLLDFSRYFLTIFAVIGLYPMFLKAVKL